MMMGKANEAGEASVTSKADEANEAIDVSEDKAIMANKAVEADWAN